MPPGQGFRNVLGNLDVSPIFFLNPSCNTSALPATTKKKNKNADPDIN